jgi:hypothetical protein
VAKELASAMLSSSPVVSVSPYVYNPGILRDIPGRIGLKEVVIGCKEVE